MLYNFCFSMKSEKTAIPNFLQALIKEHHYLIMLGQHIKVYWLKYIHIIVQFGTEAFYMYCTTHNIDHQQCFVTAIFSYSCPFK